MLTADEQRAAFALLLHAALADGVKSDAERAALRRVTDSFPSDTGGFNPWLLYQDVLAGKFPAAAAARELTRNESKLLVYEMVVGVCDSDGPPNAAEKQFLADLRTALALPAAAGASAAEAGAERIAADVPGGPAVAAVAAGPDATPPRLVPVDTAALDKTVLNYAILNGALELLPQSLATMAIVPLQMKMVYGIGKSHGYTLDRGHLRDFLATAGAGLASQAVEGYARKLLGGLAGSLLGKGLVGGLGRAAVGTGTGAAITFAATYAIGQLAVRYYGGGRRMETAVLKDTYTRLLADGQRLFGLHAGDVSARAATLSPTDVINLVRQP